MIGVYIRVSSHSQKADSQRAEITKWLEAHSHNQDSIVWFEDQESGKTLKRPGFQKLEKAIFDGQVKTVVVWKLDRLARNMRDGINVLSDWCQKGVRVVAVTQQIDLSGTVGHLVAGVLFAVAEMEYQHIRERQAVGIEVAKAKGVFIQVGRRARPTPNLHERSNSEIRGLQFQRLLTR